MANPPQEKCDARNSPTRAAEPNSSQMKAFLAGQNRSEVIQQLGFRPLGKEQSVIKDRHRARIVICDDHTLFAEACRSLLEPEFQVVGIFAGGRALVQSVRELRPDVVLLDISMPELNGLDAGEQVKQKNRAIKLVYITQTIGPDVAAEAFRRGASGYLVKHCTADELGIAVRRVLGGESYLSPLITKDTVQYLLRSDAVYEDEKRISARQREVLQLFAEGKSMKNIAYILGLKPGTVAFHKYKMMETLGVNSNAGLIEYAVKHHMVSK
jgi:DNA-binding NarL/FixJ family response regulator